MKKVSDNTYELTDEEVKLLQSKSNGLFTPDYHQTYFYLDDGGDVSACTWRDDHIDNFRLSQNNTFRTEEEAEKRKTWLEAVGRVRLYILQNHPFMSIDKDRGWEIYYRHMTTQTFSCLQSGSSQYMSLLPNTPTDEAALDVIKNREPDLRIIWGLE